MKLTRLLVALGALLAVNAVTAAASSATTVEECQDQLQSLRAATLEYKVFNSFTNAKDADRLVDKLDAAAAKLAAGKSADAVEKLTDFQTTLNALAGAPKPKVESEAAQALVTQAQGVVDCINAIGVA